MLSKFEVICNTSLVSVLCLISSEEASPRCFLASSTSNIVQYLAPTLHLVYTMAEIFGVAAGAISVASIAIQITDSLRIAIDFWEAVQYSHEKINRISTQLHILYDYMAEIQRECRKGQIQGIQEELFRKTLMMMKRNLDKLTDLVSSLMLEISPSQDSFSRKIRRVQIALNEGRLSRAEGYVENATNLLHLLQSWQSHTMLKQINSRIEVIFANSTSTEKEPSHCSELSSSSPIPASSEVPTLAGLQVYHTYNGYSNMSQQLLTRFTSSTYINLFGFIDGSSTVTRTAYLNPAQLSNSPRGNKDAKLYSSTKLTIKVLIKLSSYARGLRFQTNNLLNGYYLNSIRCIPNDSLVFKVCRSGDAQGMLKLFSAGMASSYDVDQNGLSLLHHACSFGKPDICRLLVDLGADIYQPDNYGWQVINKVLFSMLNNLLIVNRIPTSVIGYTLECGKIIHLMVEYAGIDPFQYYHLRTPNHLATPLPDAIIPYNTLVYLLGSNCFYGDSYNRIIFIRDTLDSLRQLRGDFSEVITLLCTQYEALQNCENNVYFDRSILLHSSVLRWCWAKENDDEQTKEVERKIEQILKLTKDLHRVSSDGHTALGHILRHASYDKSRTITLINNWLTLLSKNGIDSHKYLRQELQRHPDGYKVKNCCRSIKLAVSFKDAENGVQFGIENITRSIYKYLDPAYLCEAWRQRDNQPGSMSTCLSVVDEGLIYNGRPLPSAPGSWVTTIKPNTELELVNREWTGWEYTPS
ncbi:hypothetical protein V491_07313 [Pseudogymnoascus sp. VKM F-3775]|nr:hypothetical protein V491_07313 [Pseudogymnoascus sp. VKM F-3775]